MSWTRKTTWFAGVGACVLAAVGVSCSMQTAQQAAVPTAEDRVARGRYVSLIAGCNDCHTPGSLYGAPDTTRRLSGSELGWKGPWGVTYPRNLTPDPETGIGSWSEDDIVTAVRTGHRPDGSPLLPPMPWPMYANLTDEDAHALAAYLKSLPPVKHQAPAVIPPDQKATGPMLVFPPPPAWDGQNLPKPEGAPQ